MLTRIAILLISASSVASFGQQRPPSGAGSSATSVPGPAASLQTAGTVTVNQRPVTDSTGTVLLGDRIETAAGAVARISAPGLSIYLPANSCLKYTGQELELCNCGSVDVNSAQAVSVSFPARDVVVSSEGQNAAFRMSAIGRDLELINHQGTTAVAKNGSILTKLNSRAAHSFAGLGCAAPGGVAVGTASAGSVAVGTAIGLGAPAILGATVLATSTKRAPLSSLNP